MQYRRLGQTDVEVSVICLGTMTWGKQNTLEEAKEQMDYAVSEGVNFFDTAEMYAIPPSPETYGKTEGMIGKWFRSSGKRNEVFLATKIAGPGLPWIRDGKTRFDRENVFAAVDASLKRLETDYIDLYQLHWPVRNAPTFGKHWNYAPTEVNVEVETQGFITTLNALSEVIKTGKVRYVGLSNETAWAAMKYLELAKEHSLPIMQSIQNEYSLIHRVFEPHLSEVALHEKIGLLAWSPLAAGMLSGKYLNGEMPSGSRWSLLKSRPFRDTNNANRAVKGYIDVAKKHGLDVCQMALAFVHRQPFVTSTIIGATTMDQLKSNIASIDLELSDAVLADIDAVYRDFTWPF